MSKLEITLVGMRHRATPPTIDEINAACPLKLSIKREPENTHDENALAVICQEKPWAKMKLGYVPRVVAAELAPRIDAGKLEVVEAWLTEADSEAGEGEMLVTTRKLA